MRTIIMLISATTLTGSAQAATNLLANGSFEQGLSGWTVAATGQGQTGYSDPVVINYNQNSAYPTGAFGEAVGPDNAAANPGFDAVGDKFLYLSSDVGLQSISQTVTLLANTSYTFGFDYYLPANGYANSNGANLVASLNGQSFASFSAGSQPATTWLTSMAARSFTTGATGDFTFTFSANGYTAKDIGIDRVFLAATDSIGAVPEPASWAMMVGGFGLLGASMRRKKVNFTYA